MEPVSGQDDRERERHARDGVWLPAGGGQPAARGLPGSRHTPRPGIAKGEAFSPLARRRPPQVDRSPASARRNRIKLNPDLNLDHRSNGHPMPNSPKPEVVCRAE